jgi:hypothetical protein
MNSRKISFLLVTTLFVVLVLHLMAIFFKFYWTTWWFDHIVHFIAGVSVGLFYILFRRYFLWLEKYLGYLFSFLSFVLFVGIAWEVFEYYTGLTSSMEGYWLDTSIDIVADILGGFFAFLYIKENENKT